MMKKTWSILSLAFLAGLLPVHAQNLLTNPGFESGSVHQYGTGATPGWTTWGTNGFQETDFAHSGTFSVKSWLDDSGIFQDFTATVGQSFNVSAFGYDPSTDAAIGKDGLLKIEWFGASGQIGSTEIGKIFGDGVDPLNTWKLISGSAVAPTGTTFGRITLNVQANSKPMAGGVIGWDDASVTLAAVPEPSSMVMMGLGLVGLVIAVQRSRR